MAAEALKFVEDNQAGPFFLYLAITLPHANNEAGKQGMEVPDYGIYAEKDWPEAQKGYAAMISRLDQGVGRLVQKLKDLGIDDNTIVFFTSDNGPHREGGADPDFFDSNGPLRGIKTRPLRRRYPRPADRPLARPDRPPAPRAIISRPSGISCPR